ncbi:MAG: putative zinc-binding protein [Planctomycetia bacterium]|nr:putative zinc-binding protein [Planctomycetia bacterium]
MTPRLPLLFACSGCSNAGQLANDLAVELHRRGLAEMSCLAGIGAGKQHFLKQLAGREVWIIDGCAIECSLGVFDQVRELVDVHIRLHDLGIRKNVSPPTGPRFDDLVEVVLRHVAQLKQSAAPVCNDN